MVLAAMLVARPVAKLTVVLAAEPETVLMAKLAAVLVVELAAI
jgi:hypothetical protein